MPRIITFTIANNVVASRIVSKVSANNGYEGNKLKDPNPTFDDLLPENSQTNPRYINIETEDEFFRRMTINWWAGQVAAQENREFHKTRQDEINAFNITSTEV